jgi:hypothetical protein
VVGTAAELVEITANLQAAYPAGSLVIGGVAAGIAADVYVGGTLSVTLGTGLGYTYKIKSNTATDAGSTPSNIVLFTLEEAIVAPLAVTDNIVVKKDRNTLLIQGTAALDNVGVMLGAVTAIASTTQFFWVQTSGVGITKGTAGANGIALMATAAGAALTQTAGKQIIANGLEAGASHSVCNLCFPEG